MSFLPRCIGIKLYYFVPAVLLLLLSLLVFSPSSSEFQNLKSSNLLHKQNFIHELWYSEISTSSIPGYFYVKKKRGNEGKRIVAWNRSIQPTLSLIGQ